MIPAHQLAGRIQKWRERLELPIEEAVAISGVSRSTWEAIEAARATPSAWELFRIAHALGTDPGLLANPEQALGDPRRGVTRFLAPEQMDSLPPEVRRLLALAAEAGRVGAALRKMLSLPDLPLVPGSTPMQRQPWEQGYVLGEQARAILSPAPAPIASMLTLLEELGVHVAQVDLGPADIEAISLFEPRSTPIILVNSSAGRVRHAQALRAVLAHELCHLLHDATAQDIVTMVTRRSDHAIAVEQRANGFAPAFLAPPAAIVQPGDLPVAVMQRLMETWGFSREGAAWHVKNLYSLSDEQALDLREAVRARPERLREPVEQLRSADAALPVEPTELIRGLLSRLVAAALEESLISEGRASEILSIG